ncbi:MAG: hypothetical protein R3E79_18530 [Caldilineaceae bacterium]
MSTLTVMVELPESLYQSATQLAQVTNQSLGTILQESLAHTLPPLDDLPVHEVQALAHLSLLKDDELWRISAETLTVDEQAELDVLLYGQSAGNLSLRQQSSLQKLLDRYGDLLVRRAHAWLLLARRGYHVPVQEKRA